MGRTHTGPRSGPAMAEARASEPDPVSSLLIDSSLELVSSLREPLNAIAIEAENLALAAATDSAEATTTTQPGTRQPGHATAIRRARMAPPHRVRGPACSHRLQRQVASVSRAITMLERVLRERSNDAPTCDLSRVAHEACCFLRAFADRNAHRLIWDEHTLEACPVEAPERATRMTLVVLMAERLLALREGADLEVSIGTDPSGAACVALDGEFADTATSGTRVPPPALERLLSSQPIADARARIDIESASRICVRFAPMGATRAASQPGSRDPAPAQPGDSSSSDSSSSRSSSCR